MNSSLPSPLLVIDAATPAGSVALVVQGLVIGRADVPMGVTRDDTLFPAVQELLTAQGLRATDLQAVVCGAGPGSFTSLRIAGSLAKGLAFANDCPLYAVSSLALAAATHGQAGEFVVHADALRGERFALDVSIDDAGRLQVQSAVRRLSLAELALASESRARLAVLSSSEPDLERAIVTPDAAAIVRCVDWLREGPVSLDLWEPDYGRLAEAQVKWEQTHGRALADG